MFTVKVELMSRKIGAQVILLKHTRRESFVYLGGTICGDVRPGTDSQENKSLVKRLEEH